MSNYDDIIEKASADYGVPEDLIRSVMMAESRGRPGAQSPAGAQGLMQLMPSVQQQYGVEDPFDPEQSIRGGARYLSELRKKYGDDTHKVLAAWNWGPRHVDEKGIEHLPAETRTFTQRVLEGLVPTAEAGEERARPAQDTAGAQPYDDILQALASRKTEPSSRHGSSVPAASYDDILQALAPKKSPETNVEARSQQAPASGTPTPASRALGIAQGFTSDITPSKEPMVSPSAVASNLIPSAKGFGENAWEAVRHPVRTVEGLGNIALGAAESLPKMAIGLGLGGPTAQLQQEVNEQYGKPETPTPAQSAFNSFIGGLKERYGSLAKLKQTVEKDPVGFLADASSVLGGAGALTGARAVSRASEMTDPVKLAARAAGGVAKGAGYAASEMLGGSAGAGAGAIRRATEESPFNRDTAYYRGMATSADEILPEIQGSIQQVRDKRADDYFSRYRDIEGMQAPVWSVPELRQSITDVLESSRVVVTPTGSGRGGVPRFDWDRSGIDDASIPKLQKLLVQAYKWKSSNMDPAGLDALRRKIDDFYAESSNSRVIVTKLRDMVNGHLKSRVPGYAEMTSEYARSTEAIHEIERYLSGGKGASEDTMLRKLQTVFRDVNARRRQALGTLERESGEDVSGLLAGHALSQWLPRGRLGQLVGGAIGLEGAAFHPSLLAALPAMSPRFLGEAAPIAGAAFRGANVLARPIERNALAAFQVGRATSQHQDDEQ
jgi:hypothetical protein